MWTSRFYRRLTHQSILWCGNENNMVLTLVLLMMLALHTSYALWLISARQLSRQKFPINSEANSSLLSIAFACVQRTTPQHPTSATHQWLSDKAKWNRLWCKWSTFVHARTFSFVSKKRVRSLINAKSLVIIFEARIKQTQPGACIWDDELFH